MENSSALFTVGTVAEATGLSEHTIRAWEKRYGAVSPSRSGANRRLYSQAEVDRLKLLRSLIDRGHTIGQLARLEIRELSKLSLESQHVSPSEPRRSSEEAGDPALALARRAIHALDATALEEALNHACARLGVIDLLQQVFVPLLVEIETQWLGKSLSIFQEHFATAVLFSFLERTRRSIPAPEGSPRLLVTTPIHQLHEIGAKMVALVAALERWDVTYLGPNLPALEIYKACEASGASCVALSIVFPIDDGALSDELHELRVLLGHDFPIIVGGRGANAYEETLASIGAQKTGDFTTFQQILRKLRAVSRTKRK
jgi:DNA-binding transcriptional MerR regulator/methylmalonyl-CoA mutase cobalamin-binding subunit